MSSAPEFSSPSPTEFPQTHSGHGTLSRHIPFLKSVRAAIIITDIAGAIIYWNPFAEELYGWTLEEVVGRNIMEITVGAQDEEEAKRRMAELHTGNGWSGEFPVRCKNGKFLPALVTLSPLFDEAGGLAAIIGVSQDLSQRKRAEEELRTIREELEKRVQERTSELNKANESLRDLSARLLQMRDEEGRRLARELHDSVGQLLAAISMNNATVRAQTDKLNPAAARAVADNASLVEQISSEIRTISYLLHPPLLDEAGLPSALRWYIDGFCERSNIKTDLDVPPDLRLTTDMEITIFRIVQECLTNIHRHSGSNTAAIRIRQESNRIVLVAQDAGKGIAPDKLRLASDGQGGVGFRGMQERLRYLGGDLQIRSDGHGTVVTATLPLEHDPVSRAPEVA